MEAILKSKYVENQIARTPKQFVKMLKRYYKGNYDTILDVVENPLNYILNNYDLSKRYWRKVKKIVKKRIQFYKKEIEEHDYYREKKELYNERIGRLEEIVNY